MSNSHSESGMTIRSYNLGSLGELTEYSGSLSDLITELREQICSFCTQDQLASLSLTHSDWTEPAERELYRNIYLCQSSEKDDSFDLCVRTLTENEKKARFVRYLSAHLIGSEPVSTVKHVNELIVALKFMANLQSLSFCLKTQQRTDKHVFLLEEVLKEGYFSLRSLHIDYITDYAKIARYHPSLEAIGVYDLHRLILLQSSKPPSLKIEPTSTDTILDHGPLLFSYQWKENQKAPGPIFVTETVPDNAFSQLYIPHFKVTPSEVMTIGFMVQVFSEDLLKGIPEMVSSAITVFSNVTTLVLTASSVFLKPVNFELLHPILCAAPHLTELALDYGRDGSEPLIGTLTAGLSITIQGKENIFGGLLSTGQKAREAGCTKLRLVSLAGITIRWDEAKEEWYKIELTGLLGLL